MAFTIFISYVHLSGYTLFVDAGEVARPVNLPVLTIIPFSEGRCDAHSPKYEILTQKPQRVTVSSFMVFLVEFLSQFRLIILV